MFRYQDQGEGELVPGRGIRIVEILLERRDIVTLVELRSGETIEATGASFGRDIGSAWEHVYLIEGDATYFVMTSDIARLAEPDGGAILHESAEA